MPTLKSAPLTCHVQIFGKKSARNRRVLIYGCISRVKTKRFVSVLGHRKHQGEPQVLPVGELTTRPYISTCTTETEIRIRMLIKHFDEVSEIWQ